VNVRSQEQLSNFYHKLRSLHLNNIQIYNKKFLKYVVNTCITLMNTITHKSLGRFRCKNQGLQGLFRHFNGKDIRKYIYYKPRVRFDIYTNNKVWKCVFQFEYTNVPNTFSVNLYTPPTLLLDCYKHWTTATTATKTRKIPLPSHKEFLFHFKTTVSKKVFKRKL
jgi:hypothetical protein